MKRKGKLWFFVVAILIFFLAFTTIFGYSSRFGDIVTPVIKSVQDIRFGIDIRGGADVAFVPADDSVASEKDLAAAQAVIEQRLISLGVTDYEIYKDVNRSRIILRFPWKVGETDFNPETAIQELAATAMLTFREGSERDQTTSAPAGVTAETIILQGTDVKEAKAQYGPINNENQYFVSLELSEEGTKKFEEATARIASEPGGTISIWMDDQMISAPKVDKAITGSSAVISGEFTLEEAQSLADRINAGSLPFALRADSFSTISPSLGGQSLQAMAMAGIVAFILVVLFMLFNYRLHGLVSSISLLGQVAATLAFVSGYFVVFNSFTLTLPGIAGIILAIGMGVDANVITGERIKEELRAGKKLDAAIQAGFQRGISPIIDSNVTVLIVAAILMGAFGPTDKFFAKMLWPIFFAFGPSTAGAIYSFGYTLLIGVLLNFVFGVFCTRIMLTSLSKFSKLRNPRLYGAPKADAPPKQEPNYNIVGSRNKFFALSIAIMAIIGIVSFVFGVQMDVQFRGGAIITYSYTGNVELADMQTVIDESLGDGAVLQTGSTTSGGQSLTITMPGSETVSVENLEKLGTLLTENFPDNAFEQLGVSNVDASIGREFLMKSVVAVVAAALLILVYIAFRFRRIGGWLGGASAVVALVHDLIVIYGVFVILRIPLNGNFIAALLTILGYSINDTVVIYDRVRENKGLYGKKKSFSELVNMSINQSLRRSINTSATTMTALASVCIFSLVYGLDSIFTFAFPLMIGMVSGVYSTVFIAGPIWVILEEKKGKKKLTKKENA